jgi:predicted RNase H-like nuclease (RuvC/YqgF family)
MESKSQRELIMSTTSTVAVETPSAATLMESIAALGAEIDELKESLGRAETAAAASANDEAAYHKAQAEEKALQQQIAEKGHRVERLQEAHRGAVSRELDDDIKRLREEDYRLRRELEQFGEETARAMEKEKRRHEKAIEEIKHKFEDARGRMDGTRASLACALKRKMEANADEIANFVLLRDEARKKAEPLKRAIEEAEVYYHDLDEQYNQACRDGMDQHNLGVYRQRADGRKAQVEALKEKKEKLDRDIGRFTTLLRDMGGDPNHHGV